MAREIRCVCSTGKPRYQEFILIEFKCQHDIKWENFDWHASKYLRFLILSKFHSVVSWKYVLMWPLANGLMKSSSWNRSRYPCPFTRPINKPANKMYILTLAVDDAPSCCCFPLIDDRCVLIACSALFNWNILFNKWTILSKSPGQRPYEIFYVDIEFNVKITFIWAD